MAQIKVSVLDPSGGKKTQVEMPDNVPVNRLLRALVLRMGLPAVDHRGESIDYKLLDSKGGNNLELSGDSTLQSAGIQNDEVLRLHAQLKAACFLSGTRISLVGGSHTPIELLCSGDQVLSYDTTNRKLCTGIVQRKTTTMTNQYVIINDSISVTPSHIVYMNERWQPVSDLKAGHYLFSEAGQPWRVDSIKPIAQHALVHNLHLSNSEHTFFAENILVHNEQAKAGISSYPSDLPSAPDREPRQSRTTTGPKLSDVDRRLLVSEIIDAFEARTLVKIIDQIDTTQKERAATHGTIIAKPVFGLPQEDGQYRCDAFMIMPFSSQFQSIYEDHIKPVVESFSLKILRGDDFFTNRAIFEDIWSAIALSRLIIADCTGRNANVFYELGIAHTIGKPTILLTQSLGDLPFDIQGRRAILYEDRSKGLRLLQDKLREAVGALLVANQT